MAKASDVDLLQKEGRVSNCNKPRQEQPLQSPIGYVSFEMNDSDQLCVECKELQMATQTI